ncbi:AI-2E family transporter [Hutsoniella sourekii]|uniref:AI-2E family transporter n=1 Tax=Hutsoniella sourekii TaxID=87650 RepID=UPI0004800C80|nr:AI-2E family transporter [Hutsoniella sourekii]
MNHWRQLDRLIMKYLLIAGVIILLVLKFDWIRQWLDKVVIILSPILIGAGMAYILNILMVFFEKYYFPESEEDWVEKTRRPVAITLAIIVVAMTVVIVMSLIIPQLISVIQEFIRIIPLVLNQLQMWLNKNRELIPVIGDYIGQIDFNWQQIVRRAINLINNMTGNLIGTTLSTVTSLFSFLVNFLLSLMFAIYLLVSKEKLGKQFKRFLSAYTQPKWNKRILYVLDVLDYSFSNFITGEVIEAFILGSMVTVGMWIFQFPYATMIGALTGFTALIPIIGAYLSGAVGFLLIFVQSPLQALAFLVFILVVQQIEGNLIYPRVVGNSIGLPSIWVLASITVGGGLWGVMGMLLGVPIASALYKLLQNNIRYRERAGKMNEQIEA